MQATTPPNDQDANGAADMDRHSRHDRSPHPGPLPQGEGEQGCRDFHGNRLAGETSPYLLQHAHNPVDWRPWGEEALALARSEDKPILLSIGYSACHWCHVMAHESFEDEATAALMNRLFVNIKVDREERPDLDKIYQLAHQVLARRPGGWPLTVFLNPHNQAPFFAGTYFPPESRYGLPSFREALRQVADYYHQRKDGLAENNRSLLAILRTVEGGSSSAMPEAILLRQARDAMAADYDRQYGGFGGAPKFPMAGNLEFLLRYGYGGDREATDMALHALRCMAVGGLCDHLGGGFFRYSVDQRWEIPHFEKMLYDNGLLLALYSQAYAASGESLFRETALAAAGWLMAEMQSPEGGYYATLDADSEGEEGRYYVWSSDQVRQSLSAEEWPVARHCFGLDLPPNFEGRWHLRLAATPAQAAEALGLDAAAAESLLQSARAKLLQARGSRVRPGRDEKILTAWNSMAIRAMALAGRWLGRTDLTESAVGACQFLRQNAWRDGRLYACHKDGRTRFSAYLDDYAFLLDALLELLQSRWNSAWLAWAMALADDMLERFADAERGGFYFTADDHEALIHRPKPFGDDATPSGNGVAVLVLARLGHLLGESRYLAVAEQALRAAGEAMGRHPQAHGALLTALGEWLESPQTVVLRGTPESMAAWLEQADLPWHPRRMVFAIPAAEGRLPPALALRQAGDVTLAYVCRGSACLPPAASPAQLRELLAPGA